MFVDEGVFFKIVRYFFLFLFVFFVGVMMMYDVFVVFFVGVMGVIFSLILWGDGVMFIGCFVFIIIVWVVDWVYCDIMYGWVDVFLVYVVGFVLVDV